MRPEDDKRKKDKHKKHKKKEKHKKEKHAKRHKRERASSSDSERDDLTPPAPCARDARDVLAELVAHCGAGDVRALLGSLDAGEAIVLSAIEDAVARANLEQLSQCVGLSRERLPDGTVAHTRDASSPPLLDRFGALVGADTGADTNAGAGADTGADASSSADAPRAGLAEPAPRRVMGAALPPPEAIPVGPAPPAPISDDDDDAVVGPSVGSVPSSGADEPAASGARWWEKEATVTDASDASGVVAGAQKERQQSRDDWMTAVPTDRVGGDIFGQARTGSGQIARMSRGRSAPRTFQRTHTCSLLTYHYALAHLHSLTYLLSQARTFQQKITTAKADTEGWTAVGDGAADAEKSERRAPMSLAEQVINNNNNK